MKLFQFTSYLTLINLQYPKNVADFFEYFSVNIFNFLEIKPIDEEPLDCNMKNRFGVQDEIDCSFINSTFMILANIAILLVVKLILLQLIKSESASSLNKISPESNGNADDSQILNIKTEAKHKTPAPSDKLTTLQKANQYFNLAFYIYFFNSLLMDMVMASIVNLFFMGFGGFLAIIHHILSLATLVVFVGLVVKTLRIMIDLEIKRKDKVEGVHVKTKFKKWLFLRVPIKDEAKLLPRFIPEGYMVHDVMLCFFLVTFNGNAKVQIISLMLMKIYLLVNLFYRPLKETLEQVMLMGNECFFIIILTVFMILESKIDDLSLEERRTKYGKPIIIVYILMLTFNCVIGFLSTFFTVKEMCAKKKIEKESKSGGLESVIKKRQERRAERQKKQLKKKKTSEPSDGAEENKIKKKKRKAKNRRKISKKDEMKKEIEELKAGI